MSEFHLLDLPSGWTVGCFPALEALPGVAHLVTTRRALDVNLIASDRSRAAEELALALGVPEAAYLEQVHGNVIVEAAAGGLAGQGDGLIASEPGRGLMVVSADCPLILAADAAGRAVGAAHASWRGTVRRVAFGLARRMIDRYGIDPSRLVACIGPSAGPQRYEVGQDVVEAAAAGLGPEARRFFRQREGKTFFDLWGANRAQLLEAGLREENVHVAGVCTITRNDLFPSYRLEGRAAGRFAAVISKT